MEIDEIYHQIGESGKQQIKYGAVLFMLKTYTPFLVLQYTFVARSTNFQCHSEGKVFDNECFENSVLKCSNITYSEKTIVSEWNLVCDRNWLSKATMSALMFGFLLGALLLGNLADRIGRKSNMMLTLLGVLFFNLISSITTEYYVYIAARFFVGFFVSGNILSIVVLVSELVGSSYRGIYGLAIMGAFPGGIILLSSLAYYVRDWRMLTAVISLIGCPFLVLHWYLVESPRWLLNTNRVNEAKAVLSVIAKGNGTSCSPVNQVKNSYAGAGPKESLVHLLGRRRMLPVLYILCYNWFVNGATYYGLTLASGDIGTDLYTGFALSGVCELPSVLLSYLAIQTVGRRLGLAAFMAASGAACILIQILAAGPTAYLATSFALFGKMCIAGSFKVAYIFTGEIFATSIRNSGLGMMSSVARVGSILSPFIVMAGESIPGVQFTVFGVLGITGGILSLWLPETKDVPLPEIINEMALERTKKISITTL